MFVIFSANSNIILVQGTYHSRTFSATVKNLWSYMSTPLYVIMAWCLFKCKMCLLC